MQLFIKTKLTFKYSKNPIKRAITKDMKKKAKISRNPMIYKKPEFEKPVKMVDFFRSRGGSAKQLHETRMQFKLASSLS
jgi:hypothetical protein